MISISSRWIFPSANEFFRSHEAYLFSVSRQCYLYLVLPMEAIFHRRRSHWVPLRVEGGKLKQSHCPKKRTAVTCSWYRRSSHLSDIDTCRAPRPSCNIRRFQALWRDRLVVSRLYLRQSIPRVLLPSEGPRRRDSMRSSLYRPGAFRAASSTLSSRDGFPVS